MPKKTKEQTEKINKTISTKKANSVKASKDTKKTKTNTTRNTKTATKKSTSVKITKTITEKKADTNKNTRTSSTNTSRNKKLKTVTPMAVEYYDLPYKYNQTIVKILYQNPSTLFVYWEISDKDIENYKKEYGDNFFNITYPILIVHNNTMNYSFEISINDFANCWYFNTNDSNCDYSVELGRRPIKHNNDIKTDYIYISSSNTIESPNDKILFNTNEDMSIYFKNIKTNSTKKIKLQTLLKDLNLKNKKFEFPYIKNISELYQYIFETEHINNICNLSNPSSGNPTSGIL